jgi:hypothetical protein
MEKIEAYKTIDGKLFESNPIDKCIYSNDLYWGDDCCVYCGEPEERK